MGGFLVMFFLQRFLPFHHHDVHEGQPVAACGHSHPMAEHATGHLNWMSVALGLSLHSVFDGLAITAAVVSGEHGHGGMLGLGTALAVILHKPFGAMAITTLMAASAEPPQWRRAINFAFALVTPLGAMLFYLGASQIAHAHGDMLGCALAFCAGTFLCIACSDLLPELHFHAHDRLALSLALLAGLSVAVLIGYFGHAGHAEHRHVQAPILPRPAVSGSSAIDFPRPESWVIWDKIYCSCRC
jgi:zinc and cadmium transporter